MYNRRVLFFLCLCITASIYPSSEADIEKLIKKGLENCYNFEWNSAERDFEQIIHSYPQDLRGYHYKSSIYLWYYLSSNDKKDFEQFLKFSDITIQKGEEMLENFPSDEQINYTLGNTYCYRTLGYAKAESYLNAIWSSKKSEGYLKKVIEKNPSMHDAYLGLGLYNFAAAQIPSAFKWALNLAGISGDEDTGIKFIKITAEKGNLSRIEAKYYLSQLLSGAAMDYDNAAEILTGLCQRYPSNILFTYGLAVVNMKQRDNKKAEKILLNIVSKKIPEFRLVISFSNFLLGDVYFRNNDYKKALLYYSKFISSGPGKDYKGIASLRAGLSSELSGNRDLALEYYNRTPNGNQDLEDDIYALRKGKEFKEHKLSDIEIFVTRYGNMIEAGNSNDAYSGLLQIMNKSKGPLKAEILYLLSEAAFEIGKYGESVKFAREGLLIEKGKEEWITAYCYYNIARGLLKQNQKFAAEEYIEKAEDENSGDYMNRLDHMLENLRKQ